jgi:prevent-host-death family protein
MGTVVNVHDFKTHYSKYLARAAAGEEITVGKKGEAMAKLVAIPKQPRKPGLMKGKIWISDDFDAPIPELWDQIANRGLDQLKRKN